MYIKPKLLTIGVILTLGAIHSFALAADVPAGVVLAEKQVFTRNNGSEPQSLDPHKQQGVPEAQLITDLFEGLSTISPYGEIIPGSAASWEPSDNYTVWRFTMRDDAKWSNGDPVTAHDFVYSWRRFVDPTTASPYQSYLQYGHIENVDDIITGEKSPDTLGVTAVDDQTLEVKLAVPVPYFYKIVAHTSAVPVHPATVEKYGDNWTKPENFVGNGAYKLQDWVVNERIVLTRNSHYWNNAKTVINQVTFLSISSEITDVNRYRSGEIDMTDKNLPIELFQKIKQEIPNEIKVTPYLCTYYYEINHQQAPFNDVRVREALKLALDRDIMSNRIKNQGDIPAYSFTSIFIADFKLDEPAWAKWTQQARNERAKQLLTEAGYSQQQPLNFNLLYNTSDIHKKLAIAATSMWKQNSDGMINAKLENQEWKTYLDSRRQGNYQVARAGWCADYNEPTTFLNTMQSTSSNNTAFYKNPEFDALLATSMQVTSEDERFAIYRQAEKLLDQDSAIAPVYYYVNIRLVKPYVGGYTGQDPMGHTPTKQFYIIQH